MTVVRSAVPMGLSVLVLSGLAACSDSRQASNDRGRPAAAAASEAVVNAAEDQAEDSDDGTGVFYVGTGRLGLYPERRAVSPIAFLTLDEKVVRTSTEDGWAYVRVARTGQVGWLNDAQLIQRGP
jgi:hypothetical protein